MPLLTPTAVVGITNLKEQLAPGDQPKHGSAQEQSDAAEHRTRRNRTERGEQIQQVCGGLRVYRMARILHQGQQGAAGPAPDMFEPLADQRVAGRRQFSMPKLIAALIEAVLTGGSGVHKHSCQDQPRGVMRGEVL